jgi:hypothetical protein
MHPWGIELGSLMTGSKQVDHWTSGTVCECSEVAGSPQYSCTIFVAMSRYFVIFAFAYVLENLALL